MLQLMLVLELLRVVRPGAFEAAGVDERHDRLELGPVEPDAMPLADVDDHARYVAEVLAVHERFAGGAGEIADRPTRRRGALQSGHSGHRRNGAALLAIGAELGERRRVDPRAGAGRAFEQGGGPDLYAAQCPAAAGADERRRFVDGPRRLRPPMGAELHPDEHRTEARRAGGGSEGRPAVLAP